MSWLNCAVFQESYETMWGQKTKGGKEEGRKEVGREKRKERKKNLIREEVVKMGLPYFYYIFYNITNHWFIGNF